MNPSRFFIIMFLLSAFLQPIKCQLDNDPPDSPVLTLVTVIPETGFTEIQWSRSNSNDVAGYVIYYFIDGKGYAIDTILNPFATNYINTGSGAKYRTESYVAAALDTAGNVSPLSNPLTTIYTVINVDTCQSAIEVSWNPYIQFPHNLTGYRIMVSENDNEWHEVETTNSLTNNYTLTGIKTKTKYCIKVEALIEGGKVSVSNMQCADILMMKAPEWINADFATVIDNKSIFLSFSIDPLSEIKKFHLERRKEDEAEWLLLKEISIQNNTLNFTDNQVDPSERYFYRLSAINNCDIAVVYSNIASNVVAKANLTDEVIQFSWSPYAGWRGGIDYQKIMVSFGNGFTEYASLPPVDSTWSVDYSTIMYKVTGSQVCFYLISQEKINDLGIIGNSESNRVCIEPEEKIFVPNAFTPDGDNVNDYFRPVLSFIPTAYLLVITSRNNVILFESTNYLESWDGKSRDSMLSSGVYLWYLKVTAPSGKVITKNGTITILRNR